MLGVRLSVRAGRGCCPCSIEPTRCAGTCFPRRLSLKGFGVGVSAGPLGVALMPDTAWPAVSPPDGPFQALMVAI